MAESSSPAARLFAVVPAAGRSARMGQPKLLLPWQDTTLIENVLAAWLASTVERVIVVVHRDDTELARLCASSGATVIAPDTPPPDMRTSVEHGLAWIEENFSPTVKDAWLVAPADMPRLSSALIDTVALAHDPAQCRIVVPLSGGRRGHPVLFPWPLAADVFRLAPDEGLNVIVNRGPVVTVPWAGDDALVDVDTPDDFRRAREGS